MVTHVLEYIFKKGTVSKDLKFTVRQSATYKNSTNRTVTEYHLVCGGTAGTQTSERRQSLQSTFSAHTHCGPHARTHKHCYTTYTQTHELAHTNTHTHALTHTHKEGGGRETETETDRDRDRQTETERQR